MHLVKHKKQLHSFCVVFHTGQRTELEGERKLTSPLAKHEEAGLLGEEKPEGNHLPCSSHLPAATGTEHSHWGSEVRPLSSSLRACYWLRADFCALPLYMQLRRQHQCSEVDTVRTSRWEKGGKRKIAEHISHSVRSFQLRISVQCLTLQIQYLPSSPHHYKPFLNNWKKNYLVIFLVLTIFF